MFRIGEFSKISQTPITQLRYYDRIGLFQPEHTDQFTSYRYYSASQLPDLNRILAMKELGLTLDQIQRLVADNVSAEEIRGMLSLKKAQAEQELHATIERLHHIEARLRQVEQEGELSEDDIVIREISAQPFYGFRTTVPTLMTAVKYRVEMSKLLPSRVSSKVLGHFAAITHENAYVWEDADIELGYMLNDAVDDRLHLSGGQELSMRILPRVEMAACVVRVGGPENSYESYGNAGHWLEANGYKLAGPVREVFINHVPMDRLDEMVCEIQFPVTIEPRTPLPLVS